MSEVGHRWDGEGAGIPERVGAVEGPAVGRRPADEVAARREAESGARRYRFLAKAIPQILWTATPPGTLDSFNPRWSEYTGLASRRTLDRGWLGSLHPDDVPRWLENWDRAVSRGEKLSIDLRLRRVDGIYRWHLTRVMPVLSRTGRLLKWLGTCTDIDDQKRAEGMLGFLAEASKVLASTLDYETTLAAVARMTVPHVADWCVVDMLEAGGTTRRLAVAHSEPRQVELAWELARRYPPSLGDPRVPNEVLTRPDDPRSPRRSTTRCWSPRPATTSTWRCSVPRAASRPSARPWPPGAGRWA